MTENDHTNTRVLRWLSDNPGWRSLHELRSGAGLWGDYQPVKEWGNKYAPPLRRVVAHLEAAGAVETRGGWDRTFEVRAKE